jgi:hypothetical protein
MASKMVIEFYTWRSAMPTKASRIKRMRAAVSRGGVAEGATISVAGGAVRITSVKKQVIAQSPLADVVRKIKKNPKVGAKLLQEAGITTKSGRLSKSYS